MALELKRKLAVLEKISVAFNKNNITWAVGASAMLYLNGLVADFNDIDIMVVEKDISQVKRILSGLGTLQAKSHDEKYKTRVFLEYIIGGVEFDIIAGFTIVSDGSEHYFPLEKDHIKEFAKINNTPIPLQSVADWKKYYALMGRAEKVQLINKHF